MKILSCVINGFGKFQNRSFEFSKPLTEIYAENGWGKTTLADFIKCMFFGLDGRGKSVDGNERKKYSPFDGGVFGGTLVFQSKGKTYRIERSFGKTPSGDECKIYDENNSLTLEFGADPSKVGETLFGVDGESFRRSAYIPQGEIPMNGLPDNMKNRLLVLLTQANTEGESALVRLENAEKELRSRRKPAKGKLDILDEKLSEIFRKKEERRTSLVKAKEGELQAQKAVAEIEKMQTRIQELSFLIEQKTQEGDLAFQKRTLERTEWEVENLKVELTKNKEFFGEINPSSIEISSLEKAIASFYKDRESLLKMQEEGLVKRQKARKKSLFKWLGIGLGVILFGIGVWLFKKSLPVSVGCFAVGAVVILLALLLGKANKKELEQKKDVEAKKEELARLEKGIALFFEKFPVVKGEEYSIALVKIKEKRLEFERISALLFKKEKEVSVLKEKLGAENFKALNKLKEEKLALEKSKDEWLDYKGKLLARIEYLKSQGDMSELFTEERALQKEKARMERRLLAVKTARVILLKAKENLASRYLTSVEKKCGEYLQTTYPGMRSLRYTPNGEPLIDEGGQTREIGFYSEGEKDIIGLCTRLALVDALYGKEKPILIFDDPFVNLDEEKTAQAKALIQEISTEYQTLYFTCKRSLCVE